jgi:hypothetical protein
LPHRDDIVWLVTVKAGRQSRFVGVYTSDDNALDALAEWCRERWSEQHHHRKRLPKDPQGAVDRYFEYWHDMEYDIHFEHLDLGLSADRKEWAKLSRKIGDLRKEAERGASG